MKRTFIISLGGSLIVPDAINVTFLESFAHLIRARVARGDRFVIICGGGSTSRRYINAARDLGIKQSAALDMIGIAATKLNAELVKRFFDKATHPTIITDYRQFPKSRQPIVIGAGWKPGRSTDFDAVMAAEHVGADRIINCSDIDRVYDRDPQRYRTAQPLSRLTWHAFLDIVGPYRPGGNYPFDPVAARRAQARGLTVIICNGKKLANLKAILQGKRFIGTTIYPED